MNIIFKYATNYRYYYNGIDITWYIINDMDPPYFRPDIIEIEVK